MSFGAGGAGGWLEGLGLLTGGRREGAARRTLQPPASGGPRTHITKNPKKKTHYSDEERWEDFR